MIVNVQPFRVADIFFYYIYYYYYLEFSKIYVSALLVSRPTNPDWKFWNNSSKLRIEDTLMTILLNYSVIVVSLQYMMQVLVSKNCLPSSFLIFLMHNWSHYKSETERKHTGDTVNCCLWFKITAAWPLLLLSERDPNPRDGFKQPVNSHSISPIPFSPWTEV